MTCSCAITNDTGRLFSRLAGLHRLRFRVLGFEKTQFQLMEGIRQAGIQGARLLEVGCGAGYLHQTLLQEGAAIAIGVDLSRGMLEMARQGAERKALLDRVDYRLGDFVCLADDIPSADITILDKVVCCYPDWQGLLAQSLTRTRRVYALTYPRDRAAARVGIRLLRWGLSVSGCCYQPYIHDPAEIELRILGEGFEKRYQALTSSWITQVYSR